MPMTLLEMLYQQYGTNEPILLSEITFEDYSRPWIMKQLQLLCESGDLCKYEKGVYYVPTDTFFGKSILNPRKVIEKKYINDSRRIIVTIQALRCKSIEDNYTDAKCSRDIYQQ